MQMNSFASLLYNFLKLLVSKIIISQFHKILLNGWWQTESVVQLISLFCSNCLLKLRLIGFNGCASLKFERWIRSWWWTSRGSENLILVMTYESWGISTAKYSWPGLIKFFFELLIRRFLSEPSPRQSTIGVQTSVFTVQRKSFSDSMKKTDNY